MSTNMKVELDIDIDSLLAPAYSGCDEDGPVYGKPRTIAEVIAEEAAAQLLHKLTNEETRDLYHRVALVTDEEIKAQVRPLIAEALARSIQKTNQFGESTGQPTTLSEAIMAEVQRQLTKPTQGDSYGGSMRRKTLVQEIIGAEVERTIRRELADEISKARAQVSAAIRDEGARLISETIQRMARV
jgi:hypothetical protein